MADFELNIEEQQNLKSDSFSPGYLFNRPDFASSLESGSRMLASAMDHSMILPFSLVGEKIISQSGLPFGGIDFSGNEVRIEDVRSFYFQWLNELKGFNAQSVQIDLPPESYDPQGIAVQLKALLELGFSLQAETMSFHLPCSLSIEENLHSSLRRKLKLCEDNGIKVEIHNPSELENVYQNLIKWRSEKNIPLNISLEELERQINSFPDSFDLYMVRSGEQTIGVGIGVRVSEKVYYKFIPDTDPTFDRYSPMVMLTRAMTNRAKEAGCDLLDLGIAGPLGGHENPGLATFKSRLGGLPSLKCRLQKEI